MLRTLMDALGGASKKEKESTQKELASCIAEARRKIDEAIMAEESASRAMENEKEKAEHRT